LGGTYEQIYIKGWDRCRLCEPYEAFLHGDATKKTPDRHFVEHQELECLILFAKRILLDLNLLRLCEVELLSFKAVVYLNKDKTTTDYLSKYSKYHSIIVPVHVADNPYTTYHSECYHDGCHNHGHECQDDNASLKILISIQGWVKAAHVERSGAILGDSRNPTRKG